MKLIKIYALIFVSLIIIYCIINLLMDHQIVVYKSIKINSNNEIIFNYIEDLKLWEKWSPMLQKDSLIKIDYHKANGKCVAFDWYSNNTELGNGSLFITNSINNSYLKYELQNHGKTNSIGEFSLKQYPDFTIVEFKLTSEIPFLFRVLSTFIISRIEPDINKTILQLKKVSENKTK